MDWKDTLAAIKNDVPQAPSEPAETQSLPAPKNKAPQSSHLHVSMERKGRGGKTATIIDGFEISDEDIQDVARKLKQKIGIGGSARGGEILLQGDCRKKAAELLREMGFKL